uniref:Uncharacterized protein n=1 Tax=Uncultured archaeon GZfos26G2 TaxID=3386331 RepID=Q649C2_UNCAG|nr:hypothetical protein GZ35B7_38 [uncultured archaeon GZfos35B7]
MQFRVDSVLSRSSAYRTGMVSNKKHTPAGLPVKGFVVNASTWNNFMGLFIAYSILAPWLTVPTSGHSAAYISSSLCITAVNVCIFIYLLINGVSST